MQTLNPISSTGMPNTRSVDHDLVSVPCRRCNNRGSTSVCPLRLQGPCDGAALRASADVTGVPELRPQHSWVDDAAAFNCLCVQIATARSVKTPYVQHGWQTVATSLRSAASRLTASTSIRRRSLVPTHHQRRGSGFHTSICSLMLLFAFHKWTCRGDNDASRPRECDVCRPARLGNERCWLSLSKRDATFTSREPTYPSRGMAKTLRQTSSNGQDAALKLGGMNSKRKPPPCRRRSRPRRSQGPHDARSRSQREA